MRAVFAFSIYMREMCFLIFLIELFRLVKKIFSCQKSLWGLVENLNICISHSCPTTSLANKLIRKLFYLYDKSKIYNLYLCKPLIWFSVSLSLFFRLMPFYFLYFTAVPTKYEIYVLFTLKIYSDLILFPSTVPSVAFFLFFHNFFKKKEKNS